MLATQSKTLRCFLCWIGVWLGGGWSPGFLGVAQGSVILNEIVADNFGSLPDEDGDASDWIELYNTSGAPVNLLGWHLTDTTNQLALWTFPAVSLPANGYLVVFASGKNRALAGQPLHTSFSLDADGEYLALVQPDGVTVASEFAPEFPPQRAPFSYGLTQISGTNAYRVFSTPTPGGTNAGTSFEGFVSDTKFSHDRGFYDTNFNLVISTGTDGATIRYTLNGSVPSATNGFIYSGPIPISNSTTLRAVALRTGWVASDVDTMTYLFVEDVIRQSPTGQAPGPGWPAPETVLGNTVQNMDYGLDPDIVNHPVWGATIREDLKSLPTISIVTEFKHLFDPATGIYANPRSDEIAWERPASVELIDPDGGDGFQINCGLRIRGGFSRNPDNPKHAFRLFFRQEYGAAKLNYPLFGGAGADSFDKIDLRTFQNYSWSYRNDARFVALRDQLSRDLQRAMGHPHERGEFYHLYLNGQYWGLYNTDERPEAAYGETYLGGRAEDYDTIKVDADMSYVIEATDGTLDAWTRLWQAATNSVISDALYFSLQGLNVDGTPNPAYETLLDVENLIDYMLIILWSGNLDGPISNFSANGVPNNWFGLRNRLGLSGGFKFFAHDCEHTLLDVTQNRNGPWPAGSPAGGGLPKSSPQYVWQQLQSNAEFKMRVADRIQKHFFNGGVFAPETVRSMFLARSNEIFRAINCESARWGDAQRATPFNRSDWVAAMTNLYTGYLGPRWAVVTNQFRAIGLMSGLIAPVFNSPGGIVPAGFNLYLTNRNTVGTLFFTLDGSDPRVRGGGTSAGATAYTPGTPLPINTRTTVRARIRNGSTWSAITEATFFVGQDFTRLIVTEIMYNPPAFGAVPGDELEFLELKNTGTNTLDLGGLSFSAGINFTFTNGTQLGIGQFFLLGRSAASLAVRYPGVIVHGLYTGKLDNSGETLTLTHPAGGRVWSFDYNDGGRWPVTPDGHGFSLVSRFPQANPDPGNPNNWRASTNPGGSPGADDSAPALSPVLVNEALANSDGLATDAIELFNPGGAAVDLGGWFLTDDSTQPKKFRLPPGTMIDGGGYRVFTETNFNSPPGIGNGFSLSSAGEEIYLLSGDANTNLTGYSHGFSFGASPGGATFGRHVLSTGEEEFPLQSAPTLGGPNAGPAVGPVVFRQIMYHPPDFTGGFDNALDEFLELINPSGAAVPLFDPMNPTNRWRVRGAVDFDFPAGVTLPVGASLVLVNFSPADSAPRADFLSTYPLLAAVPLYGPVSGKLDNSGESVRLEQPDVPGTNGVPYVTVDEVDYHDAPPWPAGADGGGDALRRAPLTGYGSDPIHWLARTPLTILSAPTSLSVRPGTNISFIVLAAGSGALTYQWQRNGTNLPGATAATLALTNVAPVDRGEYTVRVTDESGTATTPPATLKLQVGPGIAVTPQSVTVLAGDTVRFAVTASNIATLPLGFRWRTNGVTVGFNQRDAHTDILTVSNVVIGANYSVIVTNEFNTSGVISPNAVLTVLADADGDRAPDVWENANGFDSHDGSDGALDTDGDGPTNAQEYAAGTNPRDPLSYLRIDMIGPEAGGGARLQFLAVSNRTYTVQMRDALDALAPWAGLVDILSSTNNRMISVTNGAAGANGRFYRLVTPRQF